MARALTLGNGNMLVGLDYRGQVRDLYFPFVGQSNHVSGASGSYVHRLGAFIDGNMYWFDDSSWTVSIGLPENGLTGGFMAEHTSGIVIKSDDEVHNEKNIFLRRMTVTNTSLETKSIKLFFSQQFRIAESRRGDTALYDPRVGGIIHYKGKDTFLINATIDGVQFSEYNIGLFGIEGKEGTYFDAHDGVLENNPIEHGSVDSVIGLACTLKEKATAVAEYWIACGESIPEVHILDELVMEESPERLIRSAEAYWEAWLAQSVADLSALPPEVIKLYRQSLLTMRVHTDNRGGIIASSDTDMLHHGRDTYSYVWPRDGALIAHVFDVSGYHEVSRRFFSFIASCQEPAGYLMHKYLTDGSLGSSWHAWIQRGEAELPIQEDETASIIFMLWRHYEQTLDIEYIESLYNSFIEPAAQFLCEYIEPVTGLPHASFDLWEEKYGTSTYTTASVYGGLTAASHFANLLGKENDARTYQAVAQRMKSSIINHLYNEDLGCFVKQVIHTDDGLEYDCTVDVSSVHGLLLFDVLDVDDEKIVQSIKAVESELQVHGGSHGFVRYQNDSYYTLQEAGSPNPWVITTLWMARYYINCAQKPKELKRAYELLLWTASHAGAGGTLAEQMHPHTREHKSAAPLVWSHAEFVLTVQTYLEKLDVLKK
ncbi:MAG: glycoside hydrolase family 15 protein [Candidatus Paceibacteria bacterium]